MQSASIHQRVPASMSVKEGASPYSLDIAGTPCGVPGLVTLSGAVTKLAKGDVATLRFLALGETALGPKGGIGSRRNSPGRFLRGA